MTYNDHLTHDIQREKTKRTVKSEKTEHSAQAGTAHVHTAEREEETFM